MSHLRLWNKGLTAALAFGLLFSLTLYTALAQTAPTQAAWSAWLYSSADGRMIQVNQDGYVEEFILPLNPGFDHYPASVEVAPNGTLFAYVAESSTSSQRQFTVYDHTRRSIIAIYDLYDANVSRVGTPAFNPNSTAVALGYSLPGLGWEILLIDLQTFSIVADLRYDDPSAVDAKTELRPNFAPYIHFYDGNRVAFAFYNADLPDETQGVVWESRSDLVTINPGYADPFAEIYSGTGEVVMAQHDARLASILPNTDNTLQVYIPTSGQLFPFHHDGQYTLVSPHFAQSGALVVFATGLPEMQVEWTLINRSGQILATYPDTMGIISAAGTPEGLVYLTRDTVNNMLQAVHVRIAPTGEVESGVPLYSITTDSVFSIVWVGNPGGGQIFTAGIYPEWAQVLAPQIEIVAAAPTATQVPDTVLRVGALAIVTTTGGDALNMRTVAGVDYQITRKLKRGTEVEILEGPIEQDGFRWWKVREPEGLSGWVVESVQGVVTLTPRGLFTGGETAPQTFPTPTIPIIAATPTLPQP